MRSFHWCQERADRSLPTQYMCSFKGKEGQAIVILARRHLPTSTPDCTDLLHGLGTEETLANDIYRKV